MGKKGQDCPQWPQVMVTRDITAIHSQCSPIANILLDTLVIHNLIISHDAAHSIRLNVAIY